MLTHGQVLDVAGGETNCGETVLSASTLTGGTVTMGPTGSIRGYGRIETPITYDPNACGSRNSENAARVVADETGFELEVLAPIAGVSELRSEAGTLRLGAAAIGGKPQLAGHSGCPFQRRSDCGQQCRRNGALRLLP